MSNELITIKELEQQIWETEGIKIEIFPKEGNSYNRMVRPYNYDRLPDNAEVNELSKRINKCLEPFIWYYEFKGGIKNMNKEEIKDINEILEIYNKHELPYDIFNPNIYERSKLKDRYDFRNKMVNIQGFAIITERFCESLAKFIGNRKVLEIMSGKGTLAKGLRDQGIDVKPTDNFSWGSDFFNELWVDDIENIDALAAIEKYAKDYDILLASWMPYNDPIAYDVLLKMREQNPNMIMLYIGEDWGGCCACDDFFEEAVFIEDEMIESINDGIFKSHFGIHDEIKLYV